MPDTPKEGAKLTVAELFNSAHNIIHHASENALDAIRQRVEALEAEAGAMRHACQESCLDLDPPPGKDVDWNAIVKRVFRRLEDAMDGTAGRELLAEVEQLRKQCKGLVCFSCKVAYSAKTATEKCDEAHRESWGHEWVSQRVLDLTGKLHALNVERDKLADDNRRLRESEVRLRKIAFWRRGPGTPNGNGYVCECRWDSRLHGEECPEHGVIGLPLEQPHA